MHPLHPDMSNHDHIKLFIPGPVEVRKVDLGALGSDFDVSPVRQGLKELEIHIETTWSE